MSVFRTNLPANSAALFLLSLAFIHETSAAAEKIADAKEIQQKIDSVLPKPEEHRWLRIPWQPNLMRGRLESQRVGKPMLIWIMDGNVLGCT